MAQILESKRVCSGRSPGYGITGASATIPSKYQTFITSNSDQRGFSSQAKRFHETTNENPGPGNYECIHADMEKQSTSFSKKGTGYFPSKADQFHRPLDQTPGAGSYDIPPLLTTRKEFSYASTTSNFHRPVALKSDLKTCTLPAPNSYNVESINLKKHNRVAAMSAFRSRTERQCIPKGNTAAPSPCHYNIAKGAEGYAPTSSFTSKTKRGYKTASWVPGPGTYEPYDQPPVKYVSKFLPLRRHCLRLSSPAVPLPPEAVPPGPGDYEVANYDGPARHFISSSAFVSTTKRYLDRIKENDNPGPPTYYPQLPKKQSFLYNSFRRWIPS